MANRAFRRDSATLQNELVQMDGQIRITGPFGGVGSSIVVNGLTGSLPTVLSGSSPNQFQSTYSVVRFGSGSYAVQLADVYPKLLAADFSTAGNSVTGDIAWSTKFDTAVSLVRSGTTAGVSQVPFMLIRSGSTLADPVASETVTINVHLALANSSV